MARRPKTTLDAAKSLQEMLNDILKDPTNDISPEQRRQSAKLMKRVEDLIGPLDG